MCVLDLYKDTTEHVHNTTHTTHTTSLPGVLGTTHTTYTTSLPGVLGYHPHNIHYQPTRGTGYWGTTHTTYTTSLPGVLGYYPHNIHYQPTRGTGVPPTQHTLLVISGDYFGTKGFSSPAALDFFLSSHNTPRNSRSVFSPSYSMATTITKRKPPNNSVRK